jgi:hypothetical protein
MDTTEIKDLVKKWYEYKRKSSDYEKIADKTKDIIVSYMEENDLDTIRTDDYVVTKKSMSRNFLTKKDMPEEVWQKYSRNKVFDSYYIKLRK